MDASAVNLDIDSLKVDEDVRGDLSSTPSSDFDDEAAEEKHLSVDYDSFEVLSPELSPGFKPQRIEAPSKSAAITFALDDSDNGSSKKSSAGEKQLVGMVANAAPEDWTEDFDDAVVSVNEISKMPPPAAKLRIKVHLQNHAEARTPGGRSARTSIEVIKPKKITPVQRGVRAQSFLDWGVNALDETMLSVFGATPRSASVPRRISDIGTMSPSTISSETSSKTKSSWSYLRGIVMKSVQALRSPRTPDSRASDLDTITSSGRRGDEDALSPVSPYGGLAKFRETADGCSMEDFGGDMNEDDDDEDEGSSGSDDDGDDDDEDWDEEFGFNADTSETASDDNSSSAGEGPARVSSAFEAQLRGMRQLVSSDGHSREEGLPRRYRFSRGRSSDEAAPRIVRYPHATALFTMRTKQGTRFMGGRDLEQWLYRVCDPKEAQNKASAVPIKTLQKVFRRVTPGTRQWADARVRFCWRLQHNLQCGLCTEKVLRYLRVSRRERLPAEKARASGWRRRGKFSLCSPLLEQCSTWARNRSLRACVLSAESLGKSVSHHHRVPAQPGAQMKRCYCGSARHSAGSQPRDCRKDAPRARAGYGGMGEV